MNYLIPNNPFNPDRLYKLFILGCLIVLALIISDMFHSCKKEQIEINPIKETIKEDLKRKDSVKEVIVYRDSIRTKLVTKWRNRTDTLTITEVVNLCDSVILVDSSLIASLKNEINLGDSIIRNYRIVAVNDSNTIVRLNKDLRKQKRKTKFAAAIAILLGGVAAIK